MLFFFNYFLYLSTRPLFFVCFSSLCFFTSFLSRFISLFLFLFPRFLSTKPPPSHPPRFHPSLVLLLISLISNDLFICCYIISHMLFRFFFSYSIFYCIFRYFFHDEFFFKNQTLFFFFCVLFAFVSLDEQTLLSSKYSFSLRFLGRFLCHIEIGFPYFTFRTNFPFFSISLLFARSILFPSVWLLASFSFHLCIALLSLVSSYFSLAFLFNFYFSFFLTSILLRLTFLFFPILFLILIFFLYFTFFFFLLFILFVILSSFILVNLFNLWHIFWVYFFSNLPHPISFSFLFLQ